MMDSFLIFAARQQQKPVYISHHFVMPVRRPAPPISNKRKASVELKKELRQGFREPTSQIRPIRVEQQARPLSYQT